MSPWLSMMKILFPPWRSCCWQIVVRWGHELKALTDDHRAPWSLDCQKKGREKSEQQFKIQSRVAKSARDFERQLLDCAKSDLTLQRTTLLFFLFLVSQSRRIHFMMCREDKVMYAQ